LKISARVVHTRHLEFTANVFNSHPFVRDSLWSIGHHAHERDARQLETRRLPRRHVAGNLSSEFRPISVRRCGRRAENDITLVVLQQARSAEDSICASWRECAAREIRSRHGQPASTCDVPGRTSVSECDPLTLGASQA